MRPQGKETPRLGAQGAVPDPGLLLWGSDCWAHTSLPLGQALHGVLGAAPGTDQTWHMTAVSARSGVGIRTNGTNTHTEPSPTPPPHTVPTPGLP